jgi:hypothetical protein
VRVISSLIIWLLTTGIAGCSWQNTLTVLGNTPEYLRLDEYVRVTDAPRFRLSSGARVRIARDAGVPEGWQTAAEAGVSRVFNAATSSQTRSEYELHILWPVQPSHPNVLHDLSFGIGGDGALALPAMPAQQSIDIQLADAQGNHIKQMQLHISPAMWGPVWQDVGLLEESFVHLARVLQGR